MNKEFKIECLKKDIEFHRTWIKKHEKFVWRSNGMEYFVFGYFGFGIIIRLLTHSESTWLSWGLLGLSFTLGFYMLSVGLRYFLMRDEIQKEREDLADSIDKLYELENNI